MEATEVVLDSILVELNLLKQDKDQVGRDLDRAAQEWAQVGQALVQAVQEWDRVAQEGLDLALEEHCHRQGPQEWDQGAKLDQRPLNKFQGWECRDFTKVDLSQAKVLEVVVFYRE